MITYREQKTKPFIFENLRDGYYFVERRGDNKKLVISIAGKTIHFHNEDFIGTADISESRLVFTKIYKVIGKIKDLDIRVKEFEEIYEEDTKNGI